MYWGEVVCVCVGLHKCAECTYVCVCNPPWRRPEEYMGYMEFSALSLFTFVPMRQDPPLSLEPAAVRIFLYSPTTVGLQVYMQSLSLVVILFLVCFYMDVGNLYADTAAYAMHVFTCWSWSQNRFLTACWEKQKTIPGQAHGSHNL